MTKITRHDEEQLAFNFEEAAANQHVAETRSTLSLFAQSLLNARKNKQDNTATILDNYDEDVFEVVNHLIEKKNKEAETEQLAQVANQHANKKMARLTRFNYSH